MSNYLLDTIESLNDIFAPNVTGHTTITNYKINGNDIGNIYQKLGENSNLVYWKDTLYKSDNIDLKDIFSYNVIKSNNSSNPIYYPYEDLVTGATGMAIVITENYNNIEFNNLDKFNCKYYICGGGGGGGSNNYNGNAGGGGGTGGYIEFILNNISKIDAMYIGLVGFGGIFSTGVNGQVGGTSTLSVYLVDNTSIYFNIYGGGGGGDGAHDGLIGASGGGGGSANNNAGMGGTTRVYPLPLGIDISYNYYGTYGGNGQWEPNNLGGGGGGGGQLTTGGIGNNDGGDGGDGVTTIALNNNITINFGGGGGGGGGVGYIGGIGAGGGGNGGNGIINEQFGVAAKSGLINNIWYFGGGGGGVGNGNNGNIISGNGNGAAGVVIIVITNK